MSTREGSVPAGGLGPVFGDHMEKPVFVTDNGALAEWLRSGGAEAAEYRHLPDTPDRAIVLLPTDYEIFPPWAELRQKFRGCRVLWVPLASFDPGFAAACYSIERLLHSDLEKAVERNRRILTHLLTGESFTYSATGTELAFSLVDQVHVNSRTRVALLPGEHAGVGAYFEVGLATNWMEIEEAFHINGSFRVEALLVSKHREMPGELDKTYREALDVAGELRSRVPFTIHLDDSRVTPGSFGDLDTVVHRVTNPRFGGLLTELAWGTNNDILPSVDWTINSQFNEGAGGIHIALGDGVTGAHIDFICPHGSLT